jgi:hypothetical protein
MSREVHVQVLREAGGAIPPAYSPTLCDAKSSRSFYRSRNTQRERLRKKWKELSVRLDILRTHGVEP